MKQAIILLLVVLGLAVVWYLASPLFVNQTVMEAFPYGQMSEEEYQDLQEAAVDVKVEIPTLDAMRLMTESQMDTLKQEMSVAGSEKPDVVVEEAMPTGPTVLVAGSFVDADSFHKGSGTATVYQVGEDEQLLRFEQFSVTNGPDLRVYLAPNGNAQAGIELGKLKGNLGDQNYEIPAGIDLSVFNSVVIYCKPFHVNFATAALTEVSEE